MSEKSPTQFDSYEDASVEELQSLVDNGLIDNAVGIAMIKVGQLETVLRDIEKVLMDKEGKIPKEKWEEAKNETEGEIKELNKFLERNKE